MLPLVLLLLGFRVKKNTGIRILATATTTLTTTTTFAQNERIGPQWAVIGAGLRLRLLLLLLLLLLVRFMTVR